MRITALILVFTIAIVALSGCSQQREVNPEGVEVAGRLIQCKNAASNWNCYLELAKDRGEPKLCKLIESESRVDWCYYSYAQDMKDVKICDEIKGSIVSGQEITRTKCTEEFSR